MNHLLSSDVRGIVATQERYLNSRHILHATRQTRGSHKGSDFGGRSHSLHWDTLDGKFSRASCIARRTSPALRAVAAAESARVPYHRQYILNKQQMEIRKKMNVTLTEIVAVLMISRACSHDKHICSTWAPGDTTFDLMLRLPSSTCKIQNIIINNNKYYY
jgi:hypothetical protein